MPTAAVDFQPDFCYDSFPSGGTADIPSPDCSKWRQPMAKFFRSLLLLIIMAMIVLPSAGIAADKAFAPCSLLTPAEIQAVVGKPVKPGTAKVQSNPAAGSDCTYVVGDFGSFNVLVKPLQSYETPERIKAQFAKMKMTPTDLPNVGDSSFFTSPGYTMVQLHTFKASQYILFTLLVPGAKETVVQAAAAKLMSLVVSRIK